MIEDIINVIHELEEKVKLLEGSSISQYTEGRIDGINYAIRELEKLLK